MSEDNRPGAENTPGGTTIPGASPGGTAPADTDGNTPPAATLPDTTPNDGQMVPMSELSKVRAEAAKYRTQLRDAQNAAKVAEDARKMADLSEIDMLKETARLEAEKYNTLKLSSENVLKRSAIINGAAAAGFQNPEDAANMLDLSAIDVDDQGRINPQQVVEAIKALAQEKPYLLRQAGTPPGDFGPTSPGNPQAPTHHLADVGEIEKMKARALQLTRDGNVPAATKLINRVFEMQRPKFEKLKTTEGG